MNQYPSSQISTVEIIEWVDSTFMYNWIDVDHMDDIDSRVTSIFSVGYVVKETDKVVVVSHSYWGANNTVANPIVIPKVAILTRQKFTGLAPQIKPKFKVVQEGEDGIRS